MATSPRTLGGLGLQSFWPLKDRTWKPGMDSNLLKLSYLAQITLNQAPATALPASPADGYVAIDPANGEICIRDNDDWVRVAPLAGWRAAFGSAYYRFSGSAWVDVMTTEGRIDNSLFPKSYALTAGTDANNVIDPGVYYSNSDAQMTSALNWPEQLASTVYVQRALTGNSQITQMVVTRNGTGGVANIYYRVRFGTGSGTWGGWKKTAINGDPVSFANIQLLNVASANVNTLDYYEEGTWTPGIEGATTAGTPTYGTRAGAYTRIGDRVIATGRFSLTALGGMGGGLRITSLPIAVAAGTQNVSGISFGFMTGQNFPAGSILTGFPNVGSSTCPLYVAPSSGSTINLVAAHLTDTFGVYFSINYKAA